jgi:hypothetical protein
MRMKRSLSDSGVAQFGAEFARRDRARSDRVLMRTISAMVVWRLALLGVLA